MAESQAPAYRVEDRSILLPVYKRLLVDPVLPHLPASLDPNTITHVGHALCFASMVVLLAARPLGTAHFVAAMVLVQAYLFCDNADGAHARRVGRTSAAGEYLDHGLDLLNTVYLGVVSAFALGDTGTMGLGLAILIPAASAITCWEQAATGVYQLGLLNQIEALLFVSILLAAEALFGADVLPRTVIGPVSLRDGVFAWTAISIVFGMVRAAMRVRAAGGRPGLGLLMIAFWGLVLAARATGAIGTWPGVAVAAGATLQFGARMLALRLRAETPRVAVAEALGLAGFALAFVLARLAHAEAAANALYAVTGAALGLAALAHLRTILERLRALAPSPALDKEHAA
jgi:phosphatidylglycerophosphate synthase